MFDTTQQRELASALAANYNLTPPLEVAPLDTQGMNNTAYGVRTGAGDFVLKRYDTHLAPESLRYEQALTAWLATRGLPFAVPAPIPTRSGDALLPYEGGWRVLMPWLPGRQPDRESVAEHAEVGAGLALLHRELEQCPLGERPGVHAYGDLEHVHPAIPDPYGLTAEQLGVEAGPQRDAALAWWRELLAWFRPFVEGEYRALPWQIVHGDFAPSNTLIAGGRLSAILDFEVATPDARALDLAAGLYFSLRPWEGKDRWRIAGALLRGYGRHGRLTAGEAAALPRLILLREITSRVWWFGRGVAAGDAAAHADRLVGLRELVAWVEQNGERLAALGAELTTDNSL
jgi:homoserine kinase type II